MKCVTGFVISVLLTYPACADDLPKRYPYQRCFEVASELHNLPMDLLLAVAATESNWNPDARSNRNAHGIMQIQWPVTARHLGARHVSELYNPCLNIEMGARYLKELLQQFNFGEDRALAAYNYGPGRIARETSLPDGAVAYIKTVASHRARILRGYLPTRLQPNTSHTLMTFDSQTRARRLARLLDKQIDGATVSPEKLENGYAVVLAVGVGGLTVHDRITLSEMGWKI